MDKRRASVYPAQYEKMMARFPWIGKQRDPWCQPGDMGDCGFNRP
jgi:hypothetical protein